MATIRRPVGAKGAAQGNLTDARLEKWGNVSLAPMQPCEKSLVSPEPLTNSLCEICLHNAVTDHLIPQGRISFGEFLFQTWYVLI